MNYKDEERRRTVRMAADAISTLETAINRLLADEGVGDSETHAFALGMVAGLNSWLLQPGALWNCEPIKDWPVEVRYKNQE